MRDARPPPPLALPSPTTRHPSQPTRASIKAAAYRAERKAGYVVSRAPLSYVAPVRVVALDHVQLAAPEGCELAARLFFGELLGLAEIRKPVALQAGGGVWFALGEQQLHIGVEEPFAPARKAHPALRVAAEALDELAERLSAAGAN